MCYIHHTPEHSLESFVGDNAEQCHVMVYSDADFAGDQVSAKSTSGCYVAIVGPNTFAPVTASCKAQTCVSHSSTESEIIAAEQAMRCEGLQILAFWELVTELLGTQKQNVETQKPKVVPTDAEMNPYSPQFNPGKYFAYTRKPRSSTVLIVAEDNQAVMKIIQKARSMSLRHLPRTHRIDIHWLFEVCANPQVRMTYVNTKQQVADLMTKAINAPPTWEHLLDIVQIRDGPSGPNGTPACPALLQAPPGLALPIAAACCTTCGFYTTGAPDAGCPCEWS